MRLQYTPMARDTSGRGRETDSRLRVRGVYAPGGNSGCCAMAQEPVFLPGIGHVMLLTQKHRKKTSNIVCDSDQSGAGEATGDDTDSSDGDAEVEVGMYAGSAL